MLSEDQIKFLTALTVSVPLSFVLQKLPAGKVRHIYSTLLGTLLQIFVYGYSIWMIFLLHSVIYLLILVTSKKCGKLVTLFSLGCLSFYHVYRMIIDYGGWAIDLSTVMMTITCKYSLFGYAVEDGRNKNKTLTGEQN